MVDHLSSMSSVQMFDSWVLQKISASNQKILELLLPGYGPTGWARGANGPRAFLWYSQSKAPSINKFMSNAGRTTLTKVTLTIRYMFS
jgi:hypothetical protein